METNYEKIKADLLDFFGKRNNACKEQYARLHKAESIDDVIAVVKDNFWWCAKYKDFADVIVANREQFADYQIYANQDIRVSDGVAYLIVTEGAVNAESFDTSTINCQVNNCSIFHDRLNHKIILAGDAVQVERR